MEINFNNVFVSGYLKGISLNIEVNTVTALIGDYSKDCIGKILIELHKINAGEIELGDLKITKKEKNKVRKSVGCLFNNLKNYVIKKTVSEQLDQGFEYYSGLKEDREKRKLEALKMVGLKPNYLKMTMPDLSLTEQKKVILASILLFNPEVIVLDHFEKHFNYDEQLNLKKLLLKLKKKYNKTIIVITDNQNFLLDFVDNIVVFNEGYIIARGNRDLLFNRELHRYFKVPEIVEFILKLRDKGSKIDNYYDIKELMKAIYREVK